MKIIIVGETRGVDEVEYDVRDVDRLLVIVLIIITIIVIIITICNIHYHHLEEVCHEESIQCVESHRAGSERRVCEHDTRGTEFRGVEFTTCEDREENVRRVERMNPFSEIFQQGSECRFVASGS